MATKLVTGRPQEPSYEASVVRFTKYDGYSHAAIKAQGMWFVTQSRRSVPAMYWDEFLDWVGEENWGTMELLS